MGVLSKQKNLFWSLPCSTRKKDVSFWFYRCIRSELCSFFSLRYLRYLCPCLHILPCTSVACAISVISLCYLCGLVLGTGPCAVLSLCYLCAISVLSLCYLCYLMPSLCYLCAISLIFLWNLCLYALLSLSKRKTSGTRSSKYDGALKQWT